MGKIKSTKSTANRIISMIESGDYDPDIILHMIDSIVENRDRRIRCLEERVRERVFKMTLQVVTGSLQDCIKQHGPITKEFIGSAAKRIYGNCQNLAKE